MSKQSKNKQMTKYKVILFYKFTKIQNPQKLVKEQKKICLALDIKGRMLIAKEGINATFEGTEKNINKYKKEIRKDKRFEDIVFKESKGDGKSFSKLKIKAREEVVTLGYPKINIKKETAKTITAKELQQLYKKEEDFVVLDLRNDYEIKAGYFEKTFNPELQNFRDLPQKIKSGELNELKNKKVISVCTGGIRCEKGTCLLKKAGFKNLYQLKDGIHTYMQKYPGSHFKGTLFVFDDRMTTIVKDGMKHEVVGRCIYCNKKCEQFYSDDTTSPSRKIICCHPCAKKHSDILRRCII